MVQAGGARPLRWLRYGANEGSIYGSDADGFKPVSGPVVQIDEGRLHAHLDECVLSTVEETLNALLDAEAKIMQCANTASAVIAVEARRPDVINRLRLADALKAIAVVPRDRIALQLFHHLCIYGGIQIVHRILRH